MAVGERVEHVVLAGQRLPQRLAGGRRVRRERGGVRHDLGERLRPVRPADEKFDVVPQRGGELVQPQRCVEGRDVRAARLGHGEEHAEPVAEVERPRRAAAEDADELDRPLRPAAEQEPVVVRLTEQPVGQVADRVGGRVDEQPHGPPLALGLGEHLRPLLRVLGLAEQGGEQVLAELPGRVRREVGPLGEVRHPLAEARRQLGEQVALGVAEVLGEQLGPELVAVLRDGQPDVVRGGHGVGEIASAPLRSRLVGSQRAATARERRLGVR